MTSGPYSRLYHSLVDDPDFAGIYDDDGAFSAWIRLLLIADAAFPSAAPLPRSVKKRSLQKLVGANLVVLVPGDRFRIKGLEAERAMRSHSARIAAAKRWHPTGNADAMPRREEKRKEEQGASNAHGSWNGTGLHDGRHGPGCAVCFPATPRPRAVPD